MKVIVDPADDILYKSFYIYGLGKLFGERNVSFSSKPFEELSWTSRNTKSLRFVIVKEHTMRRYVVACNDTYDVIQELYDWCDCYGSVNANFAKTPSEFHEKLVSLCPSFSVRCWGFPQTISHAICNYSRDERSARKFFGKYKRLLQRPDYEEYISFSEVKDDRYVFMLSTLWYSDEWNKNDAQVNLRRAMFVRACREAGVDFEGGMVSQGMERSSEQLFSDCLSQGVSSKVWVSKTKESAMVFNTPAFWNCHGWKLGEYLAMGKAIISTELSNDLPAPLVHGENIHFVECSEEAMKDSVVYLANHPDYRMILEKGAKEYWERYGSPIASLRLLGIEV